MGVGLGDAVAFGVAPALVGGEIYRNAELLSQVEANPDAPAAVAVAAVLNRGVLRGYQVDITIGLECHIAPGIDVAAHDVDVAGLASAFGSDADVTPCRQAAAHDVLAGLVALVLALAIAQVDADLDTGQLAVRQALCIVDRCAGAHAGVHRGQGEHAWILGLACGILHLLDVTHGIDQGDVHRAAYRGALGAGGVVGAQGVVAGLDIDLLGFDGDVALGRDHLAGGLGVLLARAQGDVAPQRGDLAAHLTGATLLLGLFGRDHASGALPPGTDFACLAVFATGAGGVGIFGTDDGQIAAGIDVDVLVRDEGAAGNGGIPTAVQLQAAAADAAANGLGRGLLAALGFLRQGQGAGQVLLQLAGTAGLAGGIALLGGTDVEIPAGLELHGIVSPHGGGFEHDIVVRRELDTVGVECGAGDGGLAARAAAGLAGEEAFLGLSSRLADTVFRDIEIDIASGAGNKCAFTLELGTLSVDVLAGGEIELGTGRDRGRDGHFARAFAHLAALAAEGAFLGLGVEGVVSVSGGEDIQVLAGVEIGLRTCRYRAGDDFEILARRNADSATGLDGGGLLADMVLLGGDLLAGAVAVGLVGCRAERQVTLGTQVEILAGAQGTTDGTQIAPRADAEVLPGRGAAAQLGDTRSTEASAAAARRFDLGTAQADVTTGIDGQVAAAAQNTAAVAHVAAGLQGQVIGRFDTCGTVGEVGPPAIGARTALVAGDGAFVENVACNRLKADVSTGNDATRPVRQVFPGKQTQPISRLDQTTVDQVVGGRGGKIIARSEGTGVV